MHWSFSSSSTHCVFVTDDFAMQEASATLKDELKTIVKLATNFRADVDTLKEEVASRAKLHGASVESNEKANSIIKKLKGQYLSLKIEVGFLREENVELTNMCVKALDGSITTPQDRQTAMDAVKKMMDASILKKNTLVEETGGLVHPIQAPQKEPDVLHVQRPTRRSPRSRRAGR